MVCGREDGEWGGEVFEAGDGEEGEEWGSVEFGSVEFVGRREGGRGWMGTYWFEGVGEKEGVFVKFFPVLPIWMV